MADDNPKVIKQRILIVDDSPEIRDFLVGYILGPQGYEVLTAADGLEGLKMAVAHRPDLMIVDVQMPYMSGLELLRRLKQRRLSIPAILATAHGSEQVAVEAFRLGVRDYVIKPFIVEEIKESIERILREARLQHERDQLIEQLAVSNTQLRRRARELNALYGIGKSVSSSLDLEKVLQRVVDAAVYLSGADEGALMLMDNQQSNLYVRASKSTATRNQAAGTPIQDNMAGRVLREKQTAILNQPSVQGEETEEEGVQSTVYVPLVARGQAIGVLTVTNQTKNRPFDNRETRVLSALASYAATAINNASLYSRSNSERNQLRTIMNQIDDPVIVTDDKHCIVLVNERARKIFKLPQGDLGGQPLAGLVDNQQIVEFAMQPTGEDLSRQVEIVTENQRVLNANMTLIEGVGRSVVFHDVTRLNELSQMKSDFVSMVSHDLRTPLTSIQGYVELLDRAGELNERQHEFVGRVEEGVAKITRLISDLLEMGRLEEGTGLLLSICSPGDILEQVMEQARMLLADKKIHLAWDVDKTLRVLGDEARLEQAFNNLLSNALKYTPEGGKITILCHQQEKQAIIKVQDTGIGIGAEDQPHIFDKFYRAESVFNSHHGTGLGLFIVKSVVDRHHGRIWVESEQGEGTTFSILLPLMREE